MSGASPVTMPPHRHASRHQRVEEKLQGLQEQLERCTEQLDVLILAVSRLAGNSVPPGHAPPVPEATPDATEGRAANATAAAAIPPPQPNQPAAAAALTPGQAPPVTAPGAPAATAAPQPGERGSVDISAAAIQASIDWATSETPTANLHGLQGGGAPNSAASSHAAVLSPVPVNLNGAVSLKAAREVEKLHAALQQMTAAPPAWSSSPQHVAPASIDRGPFPHMPSWACREVSRGGFPDWICGLCKGHKYMRDSGHINHPLHRLHNRWAWELGEDEFLRIHWTPYFGGWVH
jgi:hypothetical protein